MNKMPAVNAPLQRQHNYQQYLFRTIIGSREFSQIMAAHLLWLLIPFDSAWLLHYL